MITIFRKIRQGLISEGRIKKYLLYAVGEIVLVVIGILIALGINNANERSVIRAKEQVYLKGLENEFETSKAKLIELIRVNKVNYEGGIQIVNQMNTDSLFLDEKSFSDLLINTLAFGIAFNPNNSLLEEMVNSGSLKDIQNDSLRIELTNWISTMKDIEEQEEELTVQRESVLDLFRTEEFSIHTILDLSGGGAGLIKPGNLRSNLMLLNSLEFENKMLLFILTSHATEIAHYQPLLSRLDGILKLIHEELE